MTDREKRALIDRYVATYNAFDVDGMMATLHPNVEFENVSGGGVTASASGAEAFRRLAGQATALFSSRRQAVTAFHADESGTSIDVNYEGMLAENSTGVTRSAPAASAATHRLTVVR